MIINPEIPIAPETPSQPNLVSFDAQKEPENLDAVRIVALAALSVPTAILWASAEAICPIVERATNKIYDLRKRRVVQGLAVAAVWGASDYATYVHDMFRESNNRRNYRRNAREDQILAAMRSDGLS
jgi:hypothetical protein